MDLERVYRAYLTALDEHRFEDLEEFVHDGLVYNDRSLSRSRSTPSC